MEPLTLATAAVTFLKPYLVKAGEKAAESLGEKLPEAAANLWRAIMAKFKGKPAAEEAVADLAARPEDELTQSAFANQLRKALESDPTFAAELARLLSRAQTHNGDTIVNIGSGAVSTGNGPTTGKGGVAVQGDVHGDINLGGSRKKE